MGAVRIRERHSDVLGAAEGLIAPLPSKEYVDRFGRLAGKQEVRNGNRFGDDILEMKNRRWNSVAEAARVEVEHMLADVEVSSDCACIARFTRQVVAERKRERLDRCSRLAHSRED